ncbi:hypothetical protein EVG20_g10297 [Dentipellis fragilis]|uniref:Uncharacterized protein n=1 Tax=Dentipellis fragilis TaxID=205917 RepID=A0A4Y9XRU6_9AGAM|nr:hypothetical protein EVG20_g10297 [Dentipellis fragilis]
MTAASLKNEPPSPPSTREADKEKITSQPKSSARGGDKTPSSQCHKGRAFRRSKTVPQVNVRDAFRMIVDELPSPVEQPESAEDSMRAGQRSIIMNLVLSSSTHGLCPSPEVGELWSESVNDKLTRRSSTPNLKLCNARDAEDHSAAAGTRPTNLKKGVNRSRRSTVTSIPEEDERLSSSSGVSRSTRNISVGTVTEPTAQAQAPMPDFATWQAAFSDDLHAIRCRLDAIEVGQGATNSTMWEFFQRYVRMERTVVHHHPAPVVQIVCPCCAAPIQVSSLPAIPPTGEA